MNLPRKVSKPHVYLSQQQLAALVRASGERGVLVAVLGYTGLRWGEAIGLRVRDLDMLRRRLSVVENAVEVNGTMEVGTPKTHKRRTLVFPKLLVPALARACEGKAREDLVFPGADGSYMRRTRASKGSKSWFVTALAECGLDPMRPHDLRHTVAGDQLGSEREGGAADARPRFGGDDARCVRGPVRRRPDGTGGRPRRCGSCSGSVRFVGLCRFVRWQKPLRSAYVCGSKGLLVCGDGGI
ncbi:tyrosine-type recombinase/integrase [Curtobacterium sp. NPDC089185]|uniref:tyrosine-type recombinase/integrase n=1 Tax=Curtobacterium sp. NPDC089185 TaxID=3154968 RepID=UPI00341703B5